MDYKQVKEDLFKLLDEAILILNKYPEINIIDDNPQYVRTAADDLTYVKELIKYNIASSGGMGGMNLF